LLIIVSCGFIKLALKLIVIFKDFYSNQIWRVKITLVIIVIFISKLNINMCFLRCPTER